CLRQTAMVVADPGESFAVGRKSNEANVAKMFVLGNHRHAVQPASGGIQEGHGAERGERESSSIGGQGDYSNSMFLLETEALVTCRHVPQANQPIRFRGPPTPGSQKFSVTGKCNRPNWRLHPESARLFPRG